MHPCPPWLCKWWHHTIIKPDISLCIDKRLQQVIYFCNNNLFACSSNWRSKWAGVSLCRLGVKILPPRLNRLSAGAREGNAVLYLRNRLLTADLGNAKIQCLWKCQSTIRQLRPYNVTSNKLWKLLLLLFKSNWLPYFVTFFKIIDYFTLWLGKVICYSNTKF